MSVLDATQKRLGEAILSKGIVPLHDILGATAPRFHVHGRTFIQSLTAALEKTFPAVVSLVDKRFFAYAADTFIRAHPPVSPCLFEYGGALPDFLERFPPCAATPYLGDVARLEWLIHRAFHAAGHDDRSFFHPSVHFLSSRWPALSIWSMALGRSNANVDMTRGECVLVYRAQDDVTAERLTEDEYMTFRYMSGGVADDSADMTAFLRRFGSNPFLFNPLPPGEKP